MQKYSILNNKTGEIFDINIGDYIYIIDIHKFEKVKDKILPTYIIRTETLCSITITETCVLLNGRIMNSYAFSNREKAEEKLNTL